MVASVHPSVLRGGLRVPPSKSMAHRLLICAHLAGGAPVHNMAASQDIAATKGALAQLRGAVAGRPVPPFAAPAQPIDCNESGSTLRFMIPLYALASGDTVFTGAARLFQRPLGPYRDIFAAQGLLFYQDENRLEIGGMLASGEFLLPGDVSSQFISGLLFALPLLAGDSVLRIAPPFESRSYVELTRQAQRLFGVQSQWLDDYTLRVPGGQAYTPAEVAVEGDWSQGAVPAVLAAVTGGDFIIEGLDPGSLQGDRVVVDILRRCGAAASWQGVALRVCASGGLASPGDIDLADCPDLGPVLCALALFCRGVTRITGAGRLRMKESDRIQSVQQELQKLGGRITSTQDTITIEGGRPLHGAADTTSHNDHRVVMALCVAALGAGVPVGIGGAEAINKSWPSFFDDLAGLGAEVTLT